MFKTVLSKREKCLVCNKQSINYWHERAGMWILTGIRGAHNGIEMCSLVMEDYPQEVVLELHFEGKRLIGGKKKYAQTQGERERLT